MLCTLHLHCELVLLITFYSKPSYVNPEQNSSRDKRSAQGKAAAVFSEGVHDSGEHGITVHHYGMIDNPQYGAADEVSL